MGSSGTVRSGWAKSNISQGGSALASRWVSAGSPKRAATSRSRLVCSVTWCETYPRRAYGETTISGSFNQQTATELANQLKYGALPLTFSQATAESISTELGAQQLEAGLIAGAIGIALVFIYALLYYRLLGLVMIASALVDAAVFLGPWGELLDAFALANRHGLAICPNSAVALAGAAKLRQAGVIQKADLVVVVATAHAHKFAGTMSAYHRGGGRLANPPRRLPATLAAILEALGET